MAVYFKDLDTTRDWRAVVENLALAGLSAASFDLADAYRSIREAATGSRADPTTDERAGVWLRTTASAALLTLLNDPRFGGPLDRDPSRKAAAKAFVADALSLNGLDRFDPTDLAKRCRPSCAPRPTTSRRMTSRSTAALRRCFGASPPAPTPSTRTTTPRSPRR